ncbi:MAG: ABC transporter permease [Phycisphaerales bacterium]|nr:MAG: ABC transporter permease [Phycisphaerales bacterium]
MKRRLWHHPEFWPVAILVLLWILNAVFTPNFAHLELKDGRLYGSMVDVLNRGAQVMLLAVGMTIVIASRGIDLSVGSVMAVSGAVAAQLMVVYDQPAAIAVVAALAVCLALGFWNGMVVTVVGMQPIVATLILLVAGRGVAQLITEGQIITFEQPRFEFLGNGTLLWLPVPIWLVILVAGGVCFVMRVTAVGMYVESVGGNERAARLCGVRVGAVKLFAYTLGGACAGLAGLIYTANIKAADPINCGEYLELDAILAVVLGGTSLAGGRARVLGSLAGALIMQTITTTMLMHDVRPEKTLVVKAVATVLVCLIYTPAFRRVLTALGRRLAPPGRKEIASA